MERWELLEGSYGLYQDKELGCFTEDSIRLVHFMRLKSGDRCLDLGTGNGIIPLYVRSRGFSMEFICCRAQEATNFFSRGSLDIVTCNPPYFDCSMPAEDPGRNLMRHGEVLEEFIQTAFSLLNNGGRLYICYKATYLTTLLTILRRNCLEPKTMEIVCRNGKGELLLLEAKKLAKPGMNIFLSKRER